MLEKLINLFAEHAANYGYYAVFLVTLLENSIFLGALIPGETFAILAGVFASQKILDFRLAIILLIIGSVLGDNIGFQLGRRKGKKWLLKFGYHFGYREEKIEKSEELWKDLGGKAIFISRFVAVARTFVPFLSGASRFPYKKFVFYNFLGAIFWACTHVGLGYFFGENIKVIERSIGIIGVLLLIIFVIVVYKFLIKKGVEKIEDTD